MTLLLLLRSSVAGGQTVAAGQSVETEAATALARLKLRAVPQATESEVANTVTPKKLRAVGQAIETESANVVTKVGAIVVAVGAAVETEAATAVGRVRGVARSSEGEAALAVTPRKSRSVAQATETEVGGGTVAAKTRPVIQVVETDAAQAVGRIRTIGVANESEAGQVVTPVVVIGVNYLAAGTVVVSGSGGDLTVAYPAGIATNDVLIIDVTKADNVACSMTTFANKLGQNNTSGLRKEVWWRRRGAGDSDTNAVLTNTGTESVIARAHALRGCAPSGDPLTVVADNNSASAFGDFPDLASSPADGLLWYGLGYANDFLTDDSLWGKVVPPSAGITQATSDTSDVIVGTRLTVPRNVVVTGVRAYFGAGWTYIGGTGNGFPQTVGIFPTGVNTPLVTGTRAIGTPATGWTDIPFSTPFTLATGTEYTVAAHYIGGRYPAENAYPAFFAGTGFTSPGGAISTIAGSAGVYDYSSTFTVCPASTFSSSCYFPDLIVAGDPAITNSQGLGLTERDQTEVS